MISQRSSNLQTKTNRCCTCHIHKKRRNGLTKSIRYKVGEAFLHMPLPRALGRLETDQAAVGEKISSLELSSEECEGKMKELKIALYAKFGRAINLDD